MFSRPSFLASDNFFFPPLSSLCLFPGLDEFGEGRSSFAIVEFNPMASLVFLRSMPWEQPCVRAGSAGPVPGCWTGRDRAEFLALEQLKLGLFLVHVLFNICLKEHNVGEKNLDLWVVFLSSQKKSLYFPPLSRRKSLF